MFVKRSRTNFIKTITGKDDLLKKIEANDPWLVIAVFDTYPMNLQDVQRLANALQTNSHLRVLKLLDCNLQAEHIPLLEAGIQRNNSLEEVVIEKFMNDSMEIIASLNNIAHHVAQNSNRPNQEQGIDSPSHRH